MKTATIKECLRKQGIIKQAKKGAKKTEEIRPIVGLHDHPGEGGKGAQRATKSTLLQAQTV